MIARGELSDGITGRQLHPRGDAETAMDYWSQKIAQRAVALGAGTPAATSQPSASN